MNHFTPIANPKAIDELIARSKDVPVVIFKHSTTCSISSAAHREMTRVNGEIGLVDVLSARELSREIEVRTLVEHESPQVIILRNGEAVWHASHRKITAEAVEQATRDNA